MLNGSDSVRIVDMSRFSEVIKDSIVKAKEKGKIKIKKIEDMTTDKVEIVIHLPNDVSPDKTIDALYNDDASVRGTLEDAGVGEEAKMLSDNKYARLSWSVLRQHLMKIVGGMQ